MQTTTPSGQHMNGVGAGRPGVVDQCLREVGIGRATLLKRRGGRELERLRHATMWTAHRALRGTPRGSWGALARVFARDHTTVMSNVARAEALRLEDAAFMRLTDRLLTAVVAQDRPLEELQS